MLTKEKIKKFKISKKIDTLHNQQNQLFNYTKKEKKIAKKNLRSLI